MSSHINPLPGEPHDVLAALRALADQPDNWPDKADRLIANLGQIPQSDLVFDQENETLLSLVLDDALKGVDISSRYPVFFQQLLNDQDLRQTFLDALEALEAQPSESIVVSHSPQPVFDFLKAPTAKPIIEFVSPAKWRLIWQAALDQIQSIFFSAAQFEPVYRSDDYLEDNWVTLFRDEIEINQAQVNVVLEAVRLLAAPDMLQLQIAVSVTPDPGEMTDRLPDLTAHLTWGLYDHSVTITQRGRATFPSLPLSLVLDETNQHVTSDLQLIVEPAL